MITLSKTFTTQSLQRCHRFFLTVWSSQIVVTFSNQKELKSDGVKVMMHLLELKKWHTTTVTKGPALTQNASGRTNSPNSRKRIVPQIQMFTVSVYMTNVP